MNLMGKIFTLLIFLMSIVFLVVAVMVGASDRQWKTKAAELNDRASRAVNSLKDVQSSTEKLRKTLERERLARAEQIQVLESQNKQFKDQIAQLQAQRNDAVNLSQKRLDELEAAQNRLVKQNEQVAQLQKNNNELVDDITNQFNIASNQQIQINDQKVKIETLENDLADLVDELAKKTKVLVMLGADENYLTSHIPQPVDAVVVKVGKNGLFSIEVGKDDGIRTGHKMDIYRGQQYVGKAEVVQSSDNYSVLKGISGLMNAEVREGDNVSTKLQ